MMIKNLGTLLLIGMLSVLLVACNTTTYKHNYTFTGEGEVWSAAYVQKATEKFIDKKGERPDYETSQQSTFELKYKGEQTDLDKIKDFKYIFKGTSGEESKTLEDVNGVRSELKSERSGSGAYEQEDSIIKVVVEWDGKKEEFDLEVRK
ncbi:hypothetical protein NST74_11430 [Paenibacillus sp. FSL F4-0125]|uniref:hypothetical protein n=1 Tax=Paenibacillus sp. FSL F4-0125 TaxID=2954730 RepID=UPI0030F522C3